VVSEALAAATFEWAASRLRAAPAADLRVGHPELAAVILTPFLGQDGARVAIEGLLGGDAGG
jgi:hypothetical protein